jgi:hypothetical protein
MKFGAIQPDRPTKRIQFGQAFRKLAGSGEGKKAHLWKLLEQVTGEPLVPHRQPGEGDCVGQTFALCADLLAAADIHMRHEPEKWIAKASVEAIYGGSRVQIGGLRSWSDGSQGEWAVKFLNEYGVLHRIEYEDDDLRGYDHRRSNQYGRNGVSEDLLRIAQEHPCATYTHIKTWAQARDALYMGQPIGLCSTYAFSNKRNSNGFAKQYTGRRRKTWFHAMCLAGYDETTSKPGGLIQNSWGPDWISGPKRFDQPEGSFWATPQEIERMLQDWDDCFAISSYLGHPERTINHKLY